MKIAIGTAQLGLHYGIANQAGQPSFGEAERIISCARENGIDTVDTAAAYGNSESRLGEIGIAGMKIISKIPAIPSGTSDIRAWVYNSVTASLERLGAQALYGLLFHKPDQLLHGGGDELYAAALSLKELGIVQNIGISIYVPDELEVLTRYFSFDIVQAPINVLDRRILTSGWADKLAALGTELHARSVFLQGLLVLPPNSRPTFCSRWENVWKEYDQWTGGCANTAMKKCLSFVHNLAQVERVIVGVESHKQLVEVIEASRSECIDLDLSMDEIDESLINPTKWPK